MWPQCVGSCHGVSVGGVGNNNGSSSLPAGGGGRTAGTMGRPGWLPGLAGFPGPFGPESLLS